MPEEPRLTSELGQSQGLHQRREIKTTLVMGLIVMIVLLVFFGFWLQAQRSRVEGSVLPNPVHPRAEPERMLGVDGAMDLVRKAMAIEDQQGLRQCFHLGSVNVEEAMAFIQQLEIPPADEISFKWIGSGFGLKAHEGIVVSWRVDGELRIRLALVVPDDQETWKVDYEAFASYCKPAWEELIGGEASYGMARAVFRKDNYYNGRYDEKGWSCYRLRNLDHEEVMYGYVRKNSPQELALESIASANLSKSSANTASGGAFSSDGLSIPEDTEDNNQATRCIFEIRRNEGSLPGQFEIVRVLASDWVMEDRIFDERFKGLEQGAGADEPGQ